MMWQQFRSDQSCLPVMLIANELLGTISKLRVNLEVDFAPYQLTSKTQQEGDIAGMTIDGP